MKFQRVNVLDSDTCTASDSDDFDVEPVDFIHSDNKQIKLKFRKKVQNSLGCMIDGKLSQIDMRLLAGLTEKNVQKIEESI